MSEAVLRKVWYLQINQIKQKNSKSSNQSGKNETEKQKDQALCE